MASDQVQGQEREEPKGNSLRPPDLEQFSKLFNSYLAFTRENQAVSEAVNEAQHWGIMASLRRGCENVNGGTPSKNRKGEPHSQMRARQQAKRACAGLPSDPDGVSIKEETIDRSHAESSGGSTFQKGGFGKRQTEGGEWRGAEKRREDSEILFSK